MEFFHLAEEGVGVGGCELRFVLIFHYKFGDALMRIPGYHQSPYVSTFCKGLPRRQLVPPRFMNELGMFYAE